MEARHPGPPLEKVTLSSVGDWILAHYYLNAAQAPHASEEDGTAQPAPDDSEEGEDNGDSDLSDEVRQGLQVALNLLGQQDTRRDPLVLGLAALGWGINGHKEHLHRNSSPCRRAAAGLPAGQQALSLQLVFLQRSAPWRTFSRKLKTTFTGRDSQERY